MEAPPHVLGPSQCCLERLGTRVSLAASGGRAGPTENSPGLQAGSLESESRRGCLAFCLKKKSVSHSHQPAFHRETAEF